MILKTNKSNVDFYSTFFAMLVLLWTAVQTEKFIAITMKWLLFSKAMWLQFSIQWKSTFERGEYYMYVHRMFVR